MPFTTLLKIALFFLLVVCVIRLWPFIVMFIIAVLLAITLEPLVQWMTRHRMRRTFGVTLVAFGLIVAFALFFGVLLPQVGQEMGDFTKNIDKARAEIVQRIPPSLAFLRHALEQPQSLAPKQPVQKWLHTSLLFGKYALEGIVALVFTLVVAIYLLLEGKAFYAWLVSFVPRAQRDRVAQTAEEVSAVVLAYMRGQLITSALCAAYVLVLLLVMRVPAALFLAVAAGIFDIIPVVGTILLILAPTLVAMTVSPLRGVIVLAALILYHFIENYVIIPRVYGKQMRLSTLTVLLAITVGGALQGIVGMVLILPLVAAYPIIERMWLRPLVGSETVADHQRLEHDESGKAAQEIART